MSWTSGIQKLGLEQIATSCPMMAARKAGNHGIRQKDEENER
jgi:hypothetical protein